MIEMERMITQLNGNARAIHALVNTVSAEQAEWKPDPEAWSMRQVMDHVYNEERVDFRQHLKEMFSDPPHAWGSGPEKWASVETLQQALEGFLAEREASIQWLLGLKSPDWATESRATFGPSNEVLVMRAGDVFISWVEHDHLHLRQINELLHAWNEKQGEPYSVRYGGGW